MRDRRRRFAARLLLALGGGASLALVAAAFLDFGDPGATVRARLGAEAESLGRLVHARWREALASDQWIAEAVETRTIGAGESPSVARPRVIGPGDAEDRVRLVAARAAVAQADAASLRRVAG
ncbi:MAG: hypothetical protein AAGA20_19310, partial [Planctomycetota bacterium]